MSLTLITGPSTEPVTLAQFKQHARISRDDEDALCEACIRAARVYAERVQRRQLCTATWRLSLDCFSAEIRVPLPPLQSATIQYVDANGDTQTLDPSAYQVDAYREPGRIVPAYGTCWPDTRCQPNAVTVTFVAGYGAAAAVPETTKQAIKLLAGSFYENREGLVTGTIVAALPLGVESLLSAECWGGYA